MSYLLATAIPSMKVCIGVFPMQYVKKRRYYIDYQCFIYLAIYSE